MTLYCSTPWRDAAFFTDVAENEGFGTTADSYVIGIACSFLATVTMFPVAAALIGYGVGRCSSIRVIPRKPQAFSLWPAFATLLFGAMVVVELHYLDAALHYSHHRDTGLWSVFCITFMYVWWCCSLTHRPLDDSRPPERPNGRFLEP